MTIRFDQGDGAGATDSPTVVVAGYVRIGGSQIELAALYRFTDAKSVEAVNGKFPDWVKEIEDRYDL